MQEVFTLLHLCSWVLCSSGMWHYVVWCPTFQHWCSTKSERNKDLRI